MRYASKLSLVPTDQILTRLIHPSVFKLIGVTLPLAEPEKVETEDLTSLTYTGSQGHILVRNDGVRVLIEANFGDRPILRCALRDRQLDGTDGTSPLTVFPNTDPACNRLPAPGFLAAELSIYSWDPNTYLDGLEVQGTVGHFIADPDFYVWKNYNRDTFRNLFVQAFFLGRAPWQTAKPMSGVASFFVTRAGILLKELGYHRIDAVPSWFNVAQFFNKLGYRFTYGEHEFTFQAIQEGLKRYSRGGKALTRAQETWLVAMQNIPELDLPTGLKLPARWPVTHTNMYWVRMHLDLNPYTAADAKSAESKSADATSGNLMDQIEQMRSTSGCHADITVVVPASSICPPCTHTLGASSPAASGPAATVAAGDETPAVTDTNTGEASASDKASGSDAGTGTKTDTGSGS